MSTTLNENWLNVSGSSVWPTAFTPATKSTTTTKTDALKTAVTSPSFQWSSSWEPSPSAVQPLPKKSISPKEPSESPVTQQQQDEIESLVKPFQNFTFIDKNSSPTDAWTSQIPSSELDPKKQKKQQEKVVIEEELSKQNLYKTELCRSFQDTGLCRYGHKCQFAHGEHELRPVLRHPKYKTEICKTFSNTGNCPYGARCRFLHAPPSSDTLHQPAGPTAVETKPIAIKVPMHTPVVITVGGAKHDDDTDSDEDSAAKKSRLAFFQKLTPEKQ